MPEGTLYTRDDVSRQLREYNKNYYGQSYWNALYKNIEQSEQAALNNLAINYHGSTSALDKSYAETIADAYASSQSSNMNIAASDLGTGYKEAMIASNQNALQKAYEQYRTNYMTNKSELANAYASNVAAVEQNAASLTSDVDKLLNEQVENTQSYLQSMYDYLVYLKDKDDNKLFDKPEWSQYLDDDGNVKSFRDLFSTTNKVNPYVEQIGTDENGEPVLQLTDAGRNFYKHMFSSDAKYSFGDYLYDTNKDLYDWADSKSAHEGMLNKEMIFNDILGIDTSTENWANYVFEDKPITKTGEVLTTDKLKQPPAYEEGYKFNDDSLLVTDYIDENELENFKANDWHIAATDVVPAEGMTMEDFANKKKDLLKGQAGVASGKKGQVYDKILEAYNNGTLKNGTVFDINYGGGEAYYIYLNDRIYALSDKENVNLQTELSGVADTLRYIFGFKWLLPKTTTNVTGE